MTPGVPPMKAMVHRRYGSPDVLERAHVPRPAPGPDEVLVRVVAASINEWDWSRLHGVPFVNRVSFGLRHPRERHRILGCDVSGRVETVGADVTGLRPGDAVFGDLSASGWGGFAEYVCAPERTWAPMSSGMTFEQAAAIPQAGLLALQALRAGGVGEGSTLLVNGAGGGVGTFAIPIARSLGAEVTGVDRADKLDAMVAAGADHVVDFEQTDVTRTGATYDVIVDVMSRRTVTDYRRALAPRGRCIVVGGSTSSILRAVATGSFGRQQVRLLLYRPRRDDLLQMAELFDTGVFEPVVDETYPLDDLADAFRFYGSGRHVGKVVVTV